MRKLFFLLLVPILAFCCNGNNPGPETGPDDSGEKPAVETPSSITGSFIQQWYISGWSDTMWNREMDYLSAAGMEYLIFTPVKKNDGDPDYASLERCLKIAKSHGIKVFVGTNADDRWWEQDLPSATLDAFMQEGLSIAKEAYQRFHKTYADSFYGWYWDWEVDNVNWITRTDVLAKAWNITLDGLTSLDSSMPLLFSPFMNPTYGTATGYRDFWKKLFPLLHLRKGDIFAPQDCVGSGYLTTVTEKTWFYQLAEAAKTVDGLAFWANIENFQQFKVFGEDRFVTAPFSRMIKQKEAVESFVERIICFAYSHYYSPLLVREDYHKAYLEYVKSGSSPTPGVPGRVNSAVKEVGTGVALTWSIVTKTDVDGFAIYKNGSLLIKLQVMQDSFPGYFFDYEGKSSDSYQISAYNINGEESAKVSF